MKILLDPHMFLWAISEPNRLPTEKRRKVESLANIVRVPRQVLEPTTLPAGLTR